MRLGDAERDAFTERGVLRLPGALGHAEARRMADAIWRELEARHGVRRDAPSTWRLARVTGFQALTRVGAFTGLATPAVIDALRDLMGAGGWRAPDHWGAPLVAFPEPGATWDVPCRQWHLDFPARGPADALPGIRLIASVLGGERGGGGTVVVAGSHRLVRRLVATGQAGGGLSPALRLALAASHEWFAALWSRAPETHERVRRFMVGGACVADVDVRVEELVADPGDVVLLHPWTFHAPAPNCGRVPRFAVSHSLLRP